MVEASTLMMSPGCRCMAWLVSWIFSAPSCRRMILARFMCQAPTAFACAMLVMPAILSDIDFFLPPTLAMWSSSLNDTGTSW